jgi:hypothetical protein
MTEPRQRHSAANFRKQRAEGALLKQIGGNYDTRPAFAAALREANRSRKILKVARLFLGPQAGPPVSRGGGGRYNSGNSPSFP